MHARHGYFCPVTLQCCNATFARTRNFFTVARSYHMHEFDKARKCNLLTKIGSDGLAIVVRTRCILI